MKTSVDSVQLKEAWGESLQSSLQQQHAFAFTDTGVESHRYEIWVGGVGEEVVGWGIKLF